MTILMNIITLTTCQPANCSGYWVYQYSLIPGFQSTCSMYVYRESLGVRVCAVWGEDCVGWLLPGGRSSVVRVLIPYGRAWG